MAVHQVSFSTGLVRLNGQSVDMIEFSSIVGRDRNPVMRIWNLDARRMLSFTSGTRLTVGGPDTFCVPAQSWLEVKALQRVFIRGRGNEYVVQLVR